MRQMTLGLAFVALAGAAAFAGKYNKVVSVGDKAPAIANLSSVTPDQKEATLNLADVKEDVVVVAFLANHCPAVIGVEDRLFDTVKAYNGKSVKFIGICCSSPDGYEKTDGIDAIKGKIKEGKYNLTYGYDPQGKIGKSYGATNTPQFFVLDKERNIRYTGTLDDSTGDETKVTKTYVKTAIDNVLANETVEVTETRPQGCGIPYKR